jgi:tRNA threonylcarbamoyladenosine dehydratase
MTNVEHTLSNGERVSLPPRDSFYAELTSRNAGLISEADQERLRHARILVAGCGSIGGAAVEPLVRLGAEHLMLAEPDVYELNNLNRQNARLQDLGRNKASVQREHALDINPYAQVEVDTRGVVPDNVYGLVEAADVILDAVDLTTATALEPKFALHMYARRARRPVVTGIDIAGSQLLLVYDYRRPQQQVFDGRLGPTGLENWDPLDFLLRIVPPVSVPLEMVGPARDAVFGTRQHLPQIVYAAHLFGVLAARVVLDLLSRRRVRHLITVDVHDVVRPLPERARIQALRVAAMVRLFTDLRRARAKRRRAAAQPS